MRRALTWMSRLRAAPAPVPQHDLRTRNRHASLNSGCTRSLYAGVGYLASHGLPDFQRGAAGHALVTLQEDLALLPEARWLAQLAPQTRIQLKTNSRDAQLQAAVSGYGMAALPYYLANEEPGLKELTAPDQRLVRGIWLGVHKDTRHVPRIRMVIDTIVEGLRGQASRLSPPIL